MRATSIHYRYKLETLAALRTVQEFTVSHEVVASNGATHCNPIGIPAGRFVKLESLVAGTEGKHDVVAYLGFTPRVSAKVGRGVRQRLPLRRIRDDSGVVTIGT